MGTPSKFFVLTLLGLFLAVNADAGAACTACNQIIFKENKGQWNKKILYRADMHYAETFFERTGIMYELFDTNDLHHFRSEHPLQITYKLNEDRTVHAHAVHSTFIGAKPDAVHYGQDKVNEYYNYFIGRDRSKWANHVGGYHQFTYADIYPGIDFHAYSEGINIKYDWIIKAQNNSKTGIVSSRTKPEMKSLPIQIHYEGADQVYLSDNKLVIKTSVGAMIESAPYAYQERDGRTETVSCQYVMSAEGIVSFDFPDGWDQSRELVIDPTLVFSTYSGSLADNFGYSATYDSKSNAYSAGSVFSYGYPTTPGAFQTYWAGGHGYYQDTTQFDGSGTDVSITKYSSDGSTRIFSTYLGGDADELPHSLIVNSNDELIVFGTTASNNFPVTPNAYDTTFKGGPNPSYPANGSTPGSPGYFDGLGVWYATGSDIFITHFTLDGSALVGSTYMGGSNNDGLNYPEYQDLHYQYADEVRGTIDIDASDNIYIASCTRSSDFPTTPGAYQTTLNGVMNGVVFKMDNSLSTLVWSTYIGGDNMTDCYSLALDNARNIFVCGGTMSDSFPTTPGCYQSTMHPGAAEGFIALINPTGTAILHSTLFGTPSYDQLFLIQLDRKQNVYVLGETLDTTSFFSYNTLYNVPKSGQYISKFSYNLDTLIWSTRFGTGAGRPDISPTAFLVDICNSIYVAGWGSDFDSLYGLGPIMSTRGLYVTPDAYQHTTDGNDFYIMIMNENASAITYATYFGSPTDEEHVDGGTSRFDKKGVIYQSVCAGCASSESGNIPDQNFPTYPTNVVSHSNNSANCNNAIFKLDLNLPLVVADFYTPPTVCDTFNYQFVNNSKIIDTANTIVYWNFGDGTTSNLLNPTHAYIAPGTYTITLIIADSTSCNGSDTVQKQVTILKNDSTVALPTLTVCLGNSVQIGISPITDTATTLQWFPTSGLSNSNISDPYISPTQASSYELVTTKGNCHAKYKQQINVVSDSLIVKGANVLCPDDTIELFAHDTTGLNLSYSWTPASDVLSGANTDSPFVKPPSNTTFYVTAIDSAYGCTYKDSININVISSLQYVLATATPDTIKYGDTTQLNTIYTQAASLYWNPDSSLFSTTIANPLADPRQVTTYTVNVTDNNGCKVDKQVTVYIEYTPCSSTNLYVPNAFSPNNDGKNDVLYVRGNFIQTMYFTVYDRWGQKMFETRNQNEGWDGTYKGKKLDPAVFGWYVEGTCEVGEKFFKKGNVTLLR
jgi:gliding motility-associated-like protein